MEPFYRLNECDQIGELTWENGQLGFQGLVPSTRIKSTWGAANETLESIVQPGSTVFHHQPRHSNLNLIQAPAADINSFAATSSDSHPITWLESGQCNDMVESLDRGIRVSDCGTTLRERNTIMMTRATQENLLYHHGSDNKKEEVPESKSGTRNSNSTRRSRTAAVHNQSERKRRDRINQKMKTLQKLVPNASKTDKASMLDEVIKYLKQLQAQIQMTNYIRNMPQMMVPLGMQQQLQNQMSPLLAQTGVNMSMGLMGMGGMLNMMHMPRPTALQSVPQQFHPSTSTSNNPTFPPHFLMVPPVIPTPHISQSMNMDLYCKMAAFCSQQDNKTTTAQEKSIPSFR